MVYSIHGQAVPRILIRKGRLKSVKEKRLHCEVFQLRKRQECLVPQSIIYYTWLKDGKRISNGKKTTLRVGEETVTMVLGIIIETFLLSQYLDNKREYFIDRILTIHCKDLPGSSSVGLKKISYKETSSVVFFPASC